MTTKSTRILLAAVLMAGAAAALLATPFDVAHTPLTNNREGGQHGPRND